MNYNRTLLAGNICREPELRYTGSGTGVLSFRIAVNRTWGSGEKRRTETLFMDIEAWGRTAETIHKWFHKGDPIFIEGYLSMEQWERDGQKHTKTKVVAESFQFIAKAKAESDKWPATQSFNEPSVDEDVPF